MVIFGGLKFDIFSIPNFLATFYVLGSPVDNDLKSLLLSDKSRLLCPVTLAKGKKRAETPGKKC